MTACPHCNSPLTVRGRFVFCDNCGWEQDTIADWLLAILAITFGALACYAFICGLRALIGLVL